MSGNGDDSLNDFDDDGSNDREAGRRKDGLPFAKGNTREDGSYSIGRNRPPSEHRFRKGDGRKRGRRSKGARNADTEFERELARKVTISENGKKRKVSKSHAVDLRLLDNASRKGDNRAIEMVDLRRRRIAEARDTNRHYHSMADREILNAWIREQEMEQGPNPTLLGDPAPDIVGDISGQTTHSKNDTGNRSDD